MAVFFNSALTVNGLAGSLITALDAFLVTTCGWTKPYSGTNLAVYKQPAGSNGFYLRVDDTAGTSASIRAYESMTAVSTGSGECPTVSAVAGAGISFPKSNAASSATRNLTLLSNGKIFYGWIGYNAVGSVFSHFAFGDFVSNVAVDPYATFINAGDEITPGQLGASIASSQSGKYLMRDRLGFAPSVQAGMFTDYVRSSGAIWGNGGGVYPDEITGAIRTAPMWLSEDGTYNIRGVLPGLWCFMHGGGRVRAQGVTEVGVGVLAGKTFTFKYVGDTQMLMLETSATW